MNHKFPVCVKKKSEYKYFNTLSKTREDMSVNTILNFLNYGHDTYLFVPKQENTNVDSGIDKFTLQLLGMIYTDGNKSKTDNGICVTGINYDSLDYYTWNISSRGYSRNKITPKPIKKRKPHHSQEYRIRFYGNDYFKSNLKLIYNKYEKSINVEELSKLSVDDFSWFISGMIDGDGSINKGIVLCQKSFESKEKLQLLLSWNGVYSTIQKSGIYIPFSKFNEPFITLLKNKVTHSKRYKKLNESLFHNEKNTPRKLLKSFHSNEYSLIRIDEMIESDECIKMVDIKTEGSYFIANSIKTHNCDYFDMPYLYLRLKNCLGKKAAKCLSPIGAAYVNGFSKKLTVGGIAVLDYILLYKKFSGKMEPTYALGPIGQKIVGIGKIQYHGNLNDLYKSDINKFLEYNMTDVKIVVALDRKLKFIDLARNICHVGHVPYDNFHMSSRYLDGATLIYLKRNGGFIAPNKPSQGRQEYEDRLEEGEEGFSGAFVKEPMPGRYNWVFDLDLTSMYPNIIISLNISPETKISKINTTEYSSDSQEEKRKSVLKEIENMEKKDRERLWSNETEKEEYIKRRCIEFDMEFYVRGKLDAYHLGKTTYTKEEFTTFITESNYSLSSNGVLYRQDKRGVVPTLLSLWFQQQKI